MSDELKKLDATLDKALTELWQSDAADTKEIVNAKRRILLEIHLYLTRCATPSSSHDLESVLEEYHEFLDKD